MASTDSFPGSLQKLAIAAETTLGTFVAPTVANGGMSIEFEDGSDSFRSIPENKDFAGIRGTIERDLFTMANVKLDVQGGWNMFVTPELIDGGPTNILVKLLSLITGSDPVETVPATSDIWDYALADTIKSFSAELLRVPDATTPYVHQYAGCVISGAEFTSSEGDALKLNLECLGMTEAQVQAAAGDTVYMTGQTISVHANATLTIDAASIPIRNLQVKIENVLSDETFFNSATRQTQLIVDRNITGSFDVDVNADAMVTKAILSDLKAASAAAIHVVYAGTDNLILDMPNVVYSGESPAGAGREIFKWTVPFTAKGSGATKPLAIQIDRSP